MAATTQNPFQTVSFFFDVEKMKDCRESADVAPLSKRQKVHEGPQTFSEALFDTTFAQCSGRSSGRNEMQIPPHLQNHEAPSSEPEAFKSQLEATLQQWEKLHQRELELLQQAKQYLNSFSGDEVQGQPNHFASEIYTLLEQKTTTLGPLFQMTRVGLKQETKRNSKLPNNLSLKVVQQPLEGIVVNQFLYPAPVVTVGNLPSTVEEELFVSVNLLYHDSEKGVQPEILQGVTRVCVTNGTATFDKLLITEVSAKHKYQSFCLFFSLEEGYNPVKRVFATSKSTPFHTQSRPSRAVKRKKEEDAYGSSSDEDFILNSPEKAPETSETKHTGLVLLDYNYVDITDFLTLPQKEAATRLGISESMLCKRFKECTRRKWPYRYIDKIINMLCVQEGTPLSPEDKKKLDKLMREREERLQPVKIRITQHDRSTHVVSSPSPPSPAESPQQSSFDDEAQFVMETLEMLKTQRSPRQDS